MIESSQSKNRDVNGESVVVKKKKAGRPETDESNVIEIPIIDCGTYHQGDERVTEDSA